MTAAYECCRVWYWSMACIFFCGCNDERSTVRFVNELPDFAFVERAKWRPLLSTKTNTADVLRVMGDPLKNMRVVQRKRRPNQDRIVRHLEFVHDQDWTVSFLITLRDRHGKDTDSLAAVRLYPRKTIDFSKVEFPLVFSQVEVTGAASTSVEYSDECGLTYRIHRETHWEEGQPRNSLVSIEYDLRARCAGPAIQNMVQKW